MARRTCGERRSRRIRERLREGRGSTLPDAALLAVLIGPARGARLAAEIVERFGGAAGLAGASPGRVAALPGLGPGLAARLLAAVELGRRASGRASLRPRVAGPEDAAREARDLAEERREVMAGLYLDAQARLVRRETIAVGSLNVARAAPRDVFEPALRLLAAGVVLAHNHPSGSPEPSDDDIRFTRAIGRAAAIVGIALHDHVIVARDGFVSLRALGIRWDGGPDA